MDGQPTSKTTVEPVAEAVPGTFEYYYKCVLDAVSNKVSANYTKRFSACVTAWKSESSDAIKQAYADHLYHKHTRTDYGQGISDPVYVPLAVRENQKKLQAAVANATPEEDSSVFRFDDPMKRVMYGLAKHYRDFGISDYDIKVIFCTEAGMKGGYEIQTHKEAFWNILMETLDRYKQQDAARGR